MRSCSSPVLVNQTAEEITSVHRALPILADDDRFDGCVRCMEAQRPVGAMLVVVLDIDMQYLFQVAASHGEQPVQALDADGANPALCVGVRRGCSTGVTSTFVPSEQNTSSNARENLASRSRTRKSTRRPRSPRASGGCGPAG
jgi:hypothetical protein